MRSILAILICATCTVSAAEPAGAAAMQEAMAKMSTIGAEHAAMAQDVGEWDVQASMWMAPDAPPAISTGTSTISSILDGKWFREDHQSTWMEKPYSGLGIRGFNTLDQQYVATWYDNFSTMTMPMTGTSTDGGKTVTYTSTMPHCPMHGGPVSMRHVFVRESADRLLLTMFMTPQGGAELKHMEMVYTRR